MVFLSCTEIISNRSTVFPCSLCWWLSITKILLTHLQMLDHFGWLHQCLTTYIEAAWECVYTIIRWHSKYKIFFFSATEKIHFDIIKIVCLPISSRLEPPPADLEWVVALLNPVSMYVKQMHHDFVLFPHAVMKVNHKIECGTIWEREHLRPTLKIFLSPYCKKSGTKSVGQLLLK